MHAVPKQSHLWNWALSRIHYIQQMFSNDLVPQAPNSSTHLDLSICSKCDCRGCVSPLPVGQVWSLYLCLLHIIRVLQLRIAKKDENGTPDWMSYARDKTCSVTAVTPFERLSRVIHTGGYHITLGSWVGWVGEKFKWYRHYCRFDQPFVIDPKNYIYGLGKHAEHNYTSRCLP